MEIEKSDSISLLTCGIMDTSMSLGHPYELESGEQWPLALILICVWILNTVHCVIIYGLL